LVRPISALAHNNPGVLYQKLGQYKEAIAKYKEVLRINPNPTLTRKNFNRLLKKQLRKSFVALIR